MTERGITCTAWRPMERNTLRGFATLRIEAIKLTIAECPAHESHGRQWVSLPARPMIDAEGKALRDERGKIKYASILNWESREAQDRFSAAALRAIQDFELGITGDAGAMA